MDIVLSGVRPTGKQHIGNYFGAIKNFVKLQHEITSYFFVADYHSLTTHPKPEDLQSNVRQTAIEYLACGLDPEKCTIYVQSDVPQIPELYLIFNMMANVGHLQKAVTFKEKVRSQPENVNAGLLTYPVLMAVDIIIHRATKVPVGKDQQQHLEMTREYVNRFNHAYGVDYFPEPEAFNYGGELVKIPGLDGQGKMSKSNGENTVIYLADEEADILKKVKRAVSDSGPTEPNQEKPEAIQNLFDLMKAVSSTDTLTHFEETYNKCEIRYGDMKKQLAEDMNAFVAPIRERIKELKADTGYVNKVLQQGGEKARESAGQTIKDVREIIGLKNY